MAEDVLEQGLVQRYEYYKNILKNLTMMDDVFMRNVFKKSECTEYVLQVIMKEKDMEVSEQALQQDFKNLQGRSAIMDCIARDAKGRRFNVEIQQESEGASPKRARYHSGLVDMNTLNSGQDFNELPESHVIFITRDDVLGCGLPICHVVRKINETGEDFKDESHIVYVDSGKQEDTELGRLMHDFHCKDGDEMYSEILGSRVNELKKTKEGMDSMCEAMEKIYNGGIAIGEKRGEKRGIKIGEKRGEKTGEMKKAKETAASLAGMGFPVEQISQAVNISVETVREWLAEGCV